MDNITRLKQDLEMYAELAPEYVRDKRSPEMITTFANKYCEAVDNNDKSNKEIYFAALVLKFWDQVANIYNKTKTAGTTYDEAANVLMNCILTACDKDYRAWQKNPKLNAQQCINQTIASRGIAYIMYESNLKKNAGKIGVISLDTEIDEESGLTIGDTVADNSNSGENIISDRNYDIILEYIEHNKIVEAMIMDNIATKDVFKHEKHVEREIDEITGEEKKYTHYTSTFWPYKLVQELNDLDEDYINYFVNTYALKLEIVQAAFNDLSTANNQKKYKMIKKAQEYGRILLTK